MTIGLSFSKPIISLKIFNQENKSNPSLSNKLSHFKDFSTFKHFSFENLQSSDFYFLTLHKKQKIYSYLLNCSNLL